MKSAFFSFPALYFPDYIRALRAVGDEAGANQMLDHLEAILELRRNRGLFIEERHAAEALALRGRTEAALNALEKAERDRTIYYRWHLVLLHNEIFAGFRNHPASWRWSRGSTRPEPTARRAEAHRCRRDKFNRSSWRVSLEMGTFLISVRKSGPRACPQPGVK